MRELGLISVCFISSVLILISVGSRLNYIINFNVLVLESQNFYLGLFATVAGMGKVAR